ncbi:helix-turn-helix domain-containing protein [Lysobacter enzymogenes]|uniref:helix-turn-helix domain-containing protein n=1 Tax=Lysobacter enzymogenes TaxID=69 RepID=UPI001A96E562|nr:AraC family transcriptional regulator [Lysobacter enzymogenes]QQP97989.1 helix-turn-helix transcriptional regulator [Lysobacter enzymogenes]
MSSEHFEYQSSPRSAADPFETISEDARPASRATMADAEADPPMQDFRLYFQRDFDSVRAQPHAMSYWLQLRGRSYLESREGHLQLRAGQWLMLEPGSAPSVDTDRHGALIGFSVAPALLSEIERHWRVELHPGAGTLDRFERDALAKLWRQCATAANLAAFAAPREERLRMLRRLLGGVRDTQRELAARVRQCPGRRVARQRQVFSRLQRVRLYLRGHPDRLVPMQELAEITSFSPWWLSKTFKQVYGETLQSYGLGLRLERACELLGESGLSIAEISHACGFDSPCSFARAFRQRMQCTATQFRARRFASPRAKPDAKQTQS